jgi:hypothetical protein
MAAFAELELRYVRPVARAIQEDSAFRQWLLRGTKRHGDSVVSACPVDKDVQARLRSPAMKNEYWFNYWCGKDAIKKCTCRIGTGIETDILFILDCQDGRRLGLHIEVKRPNERLGDGQAESYPRRAACWANPDTRPRTVPPHENFLTVLVCGRELLSDERTQHFDKVVFHDEIAQRIKPYPEPAPAAAQ